MDDKTYIGYMVYGKTKIPDPGTGKEVPVPRSQWKVLENHHEPIVSKEVFEKAQSLQIRYTKKSKFDRETTLLGGYVKCGNCRRSLTSSNPRWLCKMRELSQKPDFKQSGSWSYPL